MTAPRDGESTVVETHISRLLFTPDRVHKFLKPVRTGFLDHTDPAARRAALRREFELNRRLSPDVYLGVSDLIEHGRPVDSVLTMRRLPTGRRLSALVGTPQLEPALRAVAKEIAAFHAALSPVTDPTLMGTADGLLSLWRSSFEELEADVGPVIEPEEFLHVRALVEEYLSHAGPSFADRVDHGMVVDGHGDLIADDIFILDDGPRILDCLAFADDLRISDRLADIAFLVMDIHRLAGVEAAQQLMKWYQEFSGEHHPGSLAHHYVAYRAHIRAKVEIIRHRQGADDAAERARRYHRLAHEHLVRARLRLVLVGGGPGSGKTTLAHELASRAGWLVLGSDELRKDLEGVAHDVHVDDRPGAGLYDAAHKDRTYAQLVANAGAALAAGESVVLDASWSSAAHRQLAVDIARQHGAALIELECGVARDEAKRRVARRRTDETTASDARPEIVDHLAANRDPWPTATSVDTSGPQAEVLAGAVEAVWRFDPPPHAHGTQVSSDT